MSTTRPKLLVGLFLQHQPFNLKWLLPKIREIALLYTHTLIKVFLASYPRTCQVLKFTMCVCFWCGAVWATWSDASWTCTCWKTDLWCSSQWKCSNSAPRSAFSGGGGRRERKGLYFTYRPKIGFCHYLFSDRLKRPSFSAFSYGFCTFPQLAVFSSYNSVSVIVWDDGICRSFCVVVFFTCASGGFTNLWFVLFFLYPWWRVCGLLAPLSVRLKTQFTARSFQQFSLNCSSRVWIFLRYWKRWCCWEPVFQRTTHTPA